MHKTLYNKMQSMSSIGNGNDSDGTSSGGSGSGVVKSANLRRGSAKVPHALYT